MVCQWCVGVLPTTDTQCGSTTRDKHLTEYSVNGLVNPESEIIDIEIAKSANEGEKSEND